MPFDKEERHRIIDLGLGNCQPKTGFEIHFVEVCRGNGRACSKIEKEWIQVWEAYNKSKKRDRKQTEKKDNIPDNGINHPKPKFVWMPGKFARVEPNILRECSVLYSNHYGFWSKDSPRSPGERVQLSAKKICEWLETDGAELFQASINNKMIGYSIAIKEKVKYYGSVAWVTQLVVHEDYRHQGIGKNLLFSIWTFSDYFAWGVLTSSPYAIRALEKATRRRCLPMRINKHKNMLFEFGKRNVSYVDGNMELEVNKKVSRINTEFFADHSQLSKMIIDVSNVETPWTLGDLCEGWEWFAFTFKDQDQLELTSSELEEMLDASDQVTVQAYSRMLLDNNHLWTKHTKYEVDFIINTCCAENNSAILDFGCGSGRHAISLAKSGYNVTAVDYNQNIRDNSTSIQDNLQFIHGDCRHINLDRLFQVAICLYDVIGSYVNDNDNLKIIKNLYSHLEKDGYALISVMNHELTESLATNFFSLSKEKSKLLELSPIQTMETTGNVFDPDYFMIDTDSDIVYRKEQFAKGSRLPAELLVRDKRYKKSEIIDLCRGIGFEVLWSRYVSASKWEISLSPTDVRAKEILLFCKKI